MPVLKPNKGESRDGSGDIEKRSFVFDVRVEKRENDSPRIVGHAAVFNEYTEIGGFIGGFQERVMPGAFADSIKADDIRALFNHDPNFVLGRNKAGTLQLKEDKRGLHIEIEPSDSQLVRDMVLIPLERGDISQMSFAFRTIEDKWQYAENKEELDSRDLIKVQLFDISPVTFPAYTGTDVALRSREAQKTEKAHNFNRYNKKTRLYRRRYENA